MVQLWTATQKGEKSRVVREARRGQHRGLSRQNAARLKSQVLTCQRATVSAKQMYQPSWPRAVLREAMNGREYAALSSSSRCMRSGANDAF
jgi:hypothetical protein